MANGSGRRVTSGQRVVAAAALADRARLSLAEASMWADALALMVEDGQEDAPRVLLARVTDELTAERVRSALLGRMGSADEQLVEQVREVFMAAVDVPADELPEWAEAGIVDPAGRRVYSRHTLDLDAAELADGIPWPLVTVMTFLVEGAPAGVLLEVGPGGLPHRIVAHQARRIGGALVEAADLADRVNS